MAERRDPARLEQLKAAAAYRQATEPRRMTQDEVDDKVRAILSGAAPPPPPDPLTGRIPPERTGAEEAVKLSGHVLPVTDEALRMAERPNPNLT